MANARQDVDWEFIEREYKLGQLSIRNIGKIAGIDAGAIVKRAARLEWQRDLSAKVRTAVKTTLVLQPAATQSATLPSSATKTMVLDRRLAPVPPPMTAEDEQRAVEIAAARAVEVIRSHRGILSDGLKVARTLIDAMLDECMDDHDAAIVAETGGDNAELTSLQEHQRFRMRKAVSIPARATALREVANSLGRLIPLERRAFNLDAEPDPENDKPREDPQTAAKLQQIYDKLTTGFAAVKPKPQPGALSAPVVDNEPVPIVDEVPKRFE